MPTFIVEIGRHVLCKKFFAVKADTPTRARERALELGTAIAMDPVEPRNRWRVSEPSPAKVLGVYKEHADGE